MTAPVVHWFRRDLRLGDNTALNAALDSGAPVIPLFIFDRALYKNPHSSPARMQFLIDGLHALDSALRAHGSRLVVRFGDPLAVLPGLLRSWGARALYFNRDYSPYARQRDRAVAETMGQYLRGGQVETAHDLLLHPPMTVMSQQGEPLTVFTPFKRAWLVRPILPPYTSQKGQFHRLDGIDAGDIPALRDLGMTNKIAVPRAGEAEGLRRLDRFAANALYQYKDRRDQLYADPWQETAQGTSALSPYLRFGMISTRQAYAVAQAARAEALRDDQQAGIDTWISELCWREFYVHILYHFPHVLRRSFRTAYDALEWRHAPDEYERWQAGQTGYPIVDASMRQLTEFGWMHNRARMIVASFLTKDLLIDWRAGETHFMHHLIDGDPAANNGGWQWTAGTGTDAQPYFRIFNPISQSQRYDPDGEYIRHFLPELRGVPTEYIHAPWEMPSPPQGYPPPMIDHGLARARTLAAFQAVRAED